MATQGAYRLGDGAPVTLESAHAIWTAVAREVLDEVARTGSVAHSELARQVQQRSGVYTRMPAADWLPAVVAAIDDPELTARLRADVVQTVTRPRAAAARRARPEPAPRKREAPPPAICPTCFMQLPASGRCDNCA